MTDLVEPMQETIKREKDGLDVWGDLSRYASMGHEAIAEGDYERFKWYGLYQQRPRGSGHFMLRIKIPGGRLTVSQLRGIGQISQRFARNTAAVTTRQNLQIYHVRVEDIPKIFDILHGTLGLDQRFAAGDTPRNITGCPLDGAWGEDSVDCTKVIQHVSSELVREGKTFSNLPRKLKIAIGGCLRHCHLPQINDIGFFGTTRQRGGRSERGLGLLLGGGLSDAPHWACSLRIFIPPDPDFVWDICRAVILMYRDCEHLRWNRKKARFKFRMVEVGWEHFRECLEKRLAHPLDHEASAVFPEQADMTDHLGLHEQKNGLTYLGVAIRQGRSTGDELVRLADLIEEIAPDTPVSVATTTRQNLILRDIPRGRAEDLLLALQAEGFSVQESSSGLTVISCTGNEYCNWGLVETKQRAEAIRNHLDKFIALPHPVMIGVTGCRNGCAHYHLADIGLHGIGLTHDGERGEGFHLLVGGRPGRNPVFARFIADSSGRKRKLPADSVHLAIERLLHAYRATSGPEEAFHAWVTRQPMKTLDDWVMGKTRMDVNS